jgi:hypothetical protein
MSEEPQKPQAATTAPPRDLRAGLQDGLIEEFTKNLNSEATLPNLANEALVALLSASNPSSQEVITALTLEDPIELEVPNE